MKLISEVDSRLNDSAGRETVRDIKEKFSYVALDFE